MELNAWTMRHDFVQRGLSCVRSGPISVMNSRRLTRPPWWSTGDVGEAYQVSSLIELECCTAMGRVSEGRFGSWPCENAGALQRSRMAF